MDSVLASTGAAPSAAMPGQDVFEVTMQNTDSIAHPSRAGIPAAGTDIKGLSNDIVESLISKNAGRASTQLSAHLPFSISGLNKTGHEFFGPT